MTYHFVVKQQSSYFKHWANLLELEARTDQTSPAILRFPSAVGRLLSSWYLFVWLWFILDLSPVCRWLELQPHLSKVHCFNFVTSFESSYLSFICSRFYFCFLSGWANSSMIFCLLIIEMKTLSALAERTSDRDLTTFGICFEVHSSWLLGEPMSCILTSIFCLASVVINYFYIIIK